MALYIPTATGKPELEGKYPILLCSPSKRSGLVRGADLTIVDCHTFYLRIKGDKIKALGHYLWFCQFAQEHKEDPSLVFVAPDFDWMGESEEVLDRWPKDAPALGVPNTSLFPLLRNVVGYAITKWTPRNIEPHPEWLHHFSRDYTKWEGYNGLQTYDSISQND